MRFGLVEGHLAAPRYLKKLGLSKWGEKFKGAVKHWDHQIPKVFISDSKTSEDPNCLAYSMAETWKWLNLEIKTNYSSAFLFAIQEVGHCGMFLL